MRTPAFFSRRAVDSFSPLADTPEEIASVASRTPNQPQSTSQAWGSPGDGQAQGGHRFATLFKNCLVSRRRENHEAAAGRVGGLMNRLKSAWAKPGLDPIDWSQPEYLSLFVDEPLAISNACPEIQDGPQRDVSAGCTKTKLARISAAIDRVKAVFSRAKPRTGLDPIDWQQAEPVRLPAAWPDTARHHE